MMLRNTIKQLRVYYVGYIGTIITLISVSILGMLSCELLGGAIIDSFSNKNSSSSTAISMFGSVSGFLIILGILSLVMAINYSIQRRDKSFSNLRVLGNTYKELKKMIIIETLLLTVLSLIIGIPIGVLISSPILESFKNVVGISETIKVGWDYKLILITSAIVIFLTFIVSLFVSKKLKKVSVNDAKNENVNESKVNIIFKVVLGLTLIIIPVILFNILNLEGGYGQIYMAIGLFVPIVGFGICGKYLYNSLLYLIKRALPNSSRMFYFTASFKNSLSKIVNITTSIGLIVVFQGILVTSTTVLAESKQIAATKYYKGLKTYHIDELKNIGTINTNEATVIYDIDANIAKKIKDGIPKFKGQTIEMVDGGLLYNLGDKTNGIVLKKNEVVVTTDYPKTKIGESIPVYINGAEYKFVVKYIVDSPLRKAQFTQMFVGYDPKIISGISTHDVTVISRYEITNSHLHQFNVLVNTQKGNVAAAAVTKLIQWVVITFSIINISNFILLFIYDKKEENKLKNTLGVSPRIVNASLVIQIGLISLIGIIVGFISTIMFTMPYISANHTSVVMVSNPISFGMICMGVMIGSMLFSFILLKLVKK